MRDGDLRDRFLNALDANDDAAARVLGGFLGSSTSPLPSGVCAQLGLPRGSTYGNAARLVASERGFVPRQDDTAATAS